MKFSFKALSLSAVMLLACCAQSAQAADTLMMATTTSTQDTGLLEYLNPVFKKETGIDLKWVAVGTGKALEIARNCDADVLLVHAPAAEIEFVNAGYGIDRRQIMYNDFVIVGPKTDPAKVAGKTTAEALKAIYDAKAGFCEPRRSVRNPSGGNCAVESFQPQPGQGILLYFRRTGHDGNADHRRGKRRLCHDGPRNLDQIRQQAGQ